MKILVASLLFLCATFSLAAYPTHSPQLTQLVQTLYRLEETKQLLTQVEREGAITIKTAHFGNQRSEASWTAHPRTISLNTASYRSFGSLVTSLVFELHNALSTKDFAYYDQLALSGQLNREQFIRAIEQVEYMNARKTAYVLHKGVRQGIFPSDAMMCIPPNFEDHYRIQVQAGHSTHIGYLYDDLMRYGNQTLAHNP